MFVTRGNDLRLQKSHVKYDLHKFVFFIRVVNTWNSLPNSVVSANITDAFKARLDKFCTTKIYVYNFRAQLHGIRSHSEVLHKEI